ncbi:uncharacterized protein LOC120766273 isoform X1 [Bactrocera tryoni]|uniref:uncharacterized protein LOC120766273 isoform X1 n=1 Tax=Bactrocera tryoni TaxID=59916 RepID=UPI001A97585B|nr:uncharacterized protein LOC120766273 isoform X1 [Bactrocera tryoni]
MYNFPTAVPHHFVLQLESRHLMYVGYNIWSQPYETAVRKESRTNTLNDTGWIHKTSKEKTYATRKRKAEGGRHPLSSFNRILSATDAPCDWQRQHLPQ